MAVLDACGLDSWSWALRRFHTPVSANALVLEVGSGGNPYPRSNVLLDAYEATRERHWVPLTADRPTVLGFVENLPFRDRAFDFVIASHVLEHSPHPERFIAELERVAASGYIEVPDAFLERVNPYRDHRLEITCRDETLIIMKKRSWVHDPEVVELYEDRVKQFLTSELIPRRPYEFHVRHYWANRIAYRVINPEVDAAWDPPAQVRPEPTASWAGRAREFVRVALRDMLSQRERNRSIDLLPLLRCTDCHASSLLSEASRLVCTTCGSTFERRNGLFVMNEAVKT